MPVRPDLADEPRKHAHESLLASLATAGPGVDPVSGRRTDRAPSDAQRLQAIARAGVWAVLDLADAVRSLSRAMTEEDSDAR